MIERESATQTCPKCRRVNRCLADEYGDHNCPNCGDVDRYTCGCYEEVADDEV